MRKLVLMLIAALALVALVAGCGGGGSSSGSSTDSTSTDAGGEAPTKAVFIKEADKVCGAAEKELVAEVKEFAKEKGIPLKKEPSEAQQGELFRLVILPNIGRQAEEIAALTPPEGDEGTIEELTDTLSSEVEEAEGESGAPADDTLKEASKEAKAYGFKVCGS
jgi:hypothetical protein